MKQNNMFGQNSSGLGVPSGINAGLGLSSNSGLGGLGYGGLQPAGISNISGVSDDVNEPSIDPSLL